MSATFDTSVRRRSVPIEHDLPRPTPPGRRAALTPKAWLVLADGCTVALAMVLAYVVRTSLGGADLNGARSAHLLIAVSGLPVVLVLFARARLYNVRFLTRRIDEVRRMAGAVAYAVMAMTVAAYTFQLPVSRAWLAITWLIAVVLLGVEREVVRRRFMAIRRSGRMMRRVVIVGCNAEALAVAAMIEDDPTLGYEVVGFVDDAGESDDRVLGPADQAVAVVRRTGASSVIVAASAMNVDTTNRLVRVLLREGVHVELSSTLRDIAAHRLTVRPLGRFPIVYLEPCEAGGWRAFAKRTFDFTVAGVTILATAPIALVIALAVKIDSRGPVIYRQQRVGKDGEVFEFWKFRSMVDGAHDLWIDLREQQGVDGPIFKLKDDPRITRVGRFLRKTSLDELPQLWNVLRGEMSLVGPRPALPEETLMWDDALHDRSRVRPGITGMWQVSGRSDADTSAYTRLDLYYVDNWSLLQDVIIMLKTVPVVLFGKGAY